MVSKIETSLTVPELSKRFGTTPAYIYKLLANNRLAGKRDELGQWHIPESAIVKFEMTVKRRKRGPSAGTPVVAATFPHAAVKLDKDGDAEGSLEVMPPRRRAADVFPEFKIVLGDPGTFIRRLDDLFAELRTLRQQVEALAQELHTSKG